MSLRPRRSALYMPGSNPRALDKARTLDADCLILDLEDAVAPDAKVLAREQILQALSEDGYGDRELVVRINGLDTPWGADDLKTMATAGADAICLPKVESADSVRAISAMLGEYGAPDSLRLWLMAETAQGVLKIGDIAAADPRIAVIVMGTSDLAKELRVPHTPDRLGFLTSLSWCVLAARAAQVEILDGVHLNLEDDAGLLAACEQGKTLGFDGKTLIHPKQLLAANQIFAPTEAQLANAREIIEAWKQAEAAGKGVVVVNGKLVENLHVEEAQRHLAMATVIAQRNA